MAKFTVYDPVFSSVCRDSFYEAKMQEQLQELEQLRDERHKLLAIQQELQSLHDRFSVVRSLSGNPATGETKQYEALSVRAHTDYIVIIV